jgi:hypothetical protein
MTAYKKKQGGKQFFFAANEGDHRSRDAFPFSLRTVHGPIRALS